ncbi:MAG: PQQ-binding-like beta-propeller repeat protein [Bdellovibrionaceae bacterium]|nr:PQQ-binding-like beta-propeller repeat protein [Pseudobdellovibrionaceae bacterium]
MRIFSVYAAAVFFALVILAAGMTWPRGPGAWPEPVPGSEPSLEAETATGPAAQPGGPRRKIVWREKIFSVAPDETFRALSADAEGFFIGNDAGQLRAFNPDGRRLWTFQTLFRPVGITAPVLTSRDSVFVGGFGGRFYSLNRRNGGVRWMIDLGWPIRDVSRLPGGSLLVEASSSRVGKSILYELNALTGRARLVSRGDFTERRQASDPLTAGAELGGSALRAVSVGPRDLVLLSSGELILLR